MDIFPVRHSFVPSCIIMHRGEGRELGSPASSSLNSTVESVPRSSLAVFLDMTLLNGLNKRTSRNLGWAVMPSHIASNIENSSSMDQQNFSPPALKRLTSFSPCAGKIFLHNVVLITAETRDVCLQLPYRPCLRNNFDYVTAEMYT